MPFASLNRRVIVARCEDPRRIPKRGAKELIEQPQEPSQPEGYGAVIEVDESPVILADGREVPRKANVGDVVYFPLTARHPLLGDNRQGVFSVPESQLVAKWRFDKGQTVKYLDGTPTPPSKVLVSPGLQLVQ